MADEFQIDDGLIRKLAELLHETGLSEIEFADGERRLRLTRFSAPAPASVVTVESAPMARATTAAEPAAQSGPPAGAILSPMVGTAYLSPEPGAPAFVKTGDRVAIGQTILIIEAMKVMNPIRAAKAGVVGEILVQDAQPVEFGEPLVVIA